MTEIVGSKDCGNSPRNQFAQEIAVALETGRIASGMLSNAVIWNRPLAEPLNDAAEVEHALEHCAALDSVTVEHAISHGRTGMASGESLLSDGTRRRFCHVFEYTNTKGNCVAVIKSYA